MAKLKFPATLGRDFSGIVAEVGAGVSDFKKGDEVYCYARVLSGKTFPLEQGGEALTYQQKGYQEARLS